MRARASAPFVKGSISYGDYAMSRSLMRAARTLRAINNTCARGERERESEYLRAAAGKAFYERALVYLPRVGFNDPRESL